LWVIGPAYRSRIWPTVISRILKSTKVSHPYNQGRKHLSMVTECGGRVHSGGLPTLTVHKYRADFTKVRSQSKRYKVQEGGVTSRAIREKVKGLCFRQQVLFGV
jgi:hypothetical protein